jgi:flagellar motor switch protein FliG
MALSGYEKAALFLSAVGEEIAARIMKNLDKDTIRQISTYMSHPTVPDHGAIEGVLGELSHKVHTGTLQVGGETYLRNVLQKSIGDTEAEKIMSIVSKESSLDALKWVDSAKLASFLVSEHPQTIALILCLLEPEHAAEVMQGLPEEIRGNVGLRVASTDRIPEIALEEIEKVLKVQLDMGKAKGREGKAFKGTKVIAEILNQLERKMEQEVLEQIEESNSELAEAIQELMLVFDDLEKMDDKGIQMILKESSTEDLSYALKSASEALKEKVFSNLSKRAGTLLQEEIEMKGAVRVSEVEAAQRNIVKIARKLDEDGLIVIAGRTKEEFVE